MSVSFLPHPVLLLGARETRELHLPPVCPYFPFPSSFSPSSQLFPGGSHSSFVSIIQVEHLEARLCLHLSPSHSISMMFIQSSALFSIPTPHMSSHWSSFLCSCLPFLVVFYLNSSICLRVHIYKMFFVMVQKFP